MKFSYKESEVAGLVYVSCLVSVESLLSDGSRARVKDYGLTCSYRKATGGPLREMEREDRFNSARSFRKIATALEAMIAEGETAEGHLMLSPEKL